MEIGKKIEHARAHCADLLFHHMRRADESASALRGFLISWCLAFAGYLAETADTLRDHWVPLVLVSISAVIAAGSWVHQKDKSLRRVELLLMEDFKSYAHDRFLANENLDVIALVLLFLAIGWEIAIRLSVV